jgi:hypothetical protein
MFHPVDRPMERGWVGRIDGDRVIHLAAQTLQSLFTGGGTAREHAVYPLEDVRLLAPVLHPPAVRVFADQAMFTFANPAAIIGPGAEVPAAHGAPNSSLAQGSLTVHPRIAAVIGADGASAGFTGFAQWRASRLHAPKDRDFALGLGPLVVTGDELAVDGLEVVLRVDGDERARARVGSFDWSAARDLAESGTKLMPGDLLVGPSALSAEISRGGFVELELEGIGVLDHVVADA